MVSFLAAMPHRGSKETILSESRDVAKRKKDSMTAIFPLYCKIFCKTKTGNVLLSQAASHQVSSALRSLTTVFEMGTGVTSSLLSPDFQVVPWKLNKSIKSVFKNHWSSFRPISIGQLNVSPHLHLRPINVIVSHGSYHYWRKSILVGGFALRCFQRLSRP